MKIKQIGNGGAFNYKETNSSFIIENNDKYLLFDCGYSVYEKLRQLDSTKEIDLKKLDAVYISHFDDDHIGSLKTLLYYQYFVNNIIMDVIVSENLYNEMNIFLKELDSYYDNYQKVQAQMFDLYSIESGSSLSHNGIDLSIIPCNHHIPCFGLVALDSINKNIFIISGDTRAIPLLDQFYFSLKDKHPDYSIIVYHDISNWDCPEKQVHMCCTDMNLVYDKEFIKILNFYHNDDINYIKEWR